MRLKFILFLIKLLNIDIYKVAPTQDLFIHPKHREVVKLKSGNQYSSYGMDENFAKEIKQESIRRSLESMSHKILQQQLYTFNKMDQEGPMGRTTHTEVEIEILKPVNK